MRNLSSKSIDQTPHFECKAPQIAVMSMAVPYFIDGERTRLVGTLDHHGLRYSTILHVVIHTANDSGDYLVMARPDRQARMLSCTDDAVDKLQ